MRIISCLAPTIVRRFRPGAPAGAANPSATRSRQRGQVLPLFVLITVVLLGGAALLTDAAWWWTTEQRMKRAADAGALAGAVYLPANPGAARVAARAETKKNGFEHGVDGVIVTAEQDSLDPRKLIVDIDAPVQTFFARVFSIETIPASVTGAGKYVLPVPMGSPQNYYGVGRLVDAVTISRPEPRTGTVATAEPTTFLSGGWSNPQGAYAAGDASADSDGDAHVWYGFDFSDLPDPLTITGIRVRLGDAEVSGFSNPPDCRIEARLSWDSGGTWSSPIESSRLTRTDATLYFPPGSTNDAWQPPTDWEPPVHSWTRAELISGLRVELTRVGNGTDCGGQVARFGQLDVQVRYDWTETILETSIQEVAVRDPYDTGDLEPQNFWGALQSQGAPNIQGDAYMTYYDTRQLPLNEDFKPQSYYQYGVEFPPGSSDGEIWLFDPGFCNVDSNKGTGEYYTFGNPNGSSSYNPVSTYFEAWADYDFTPLDPDDDTEEYRSGSDFELLSLYDSDIYTGSNSRITSLDLCNDLEWHNDWVKVADDIDNPSSDQPLVVRLHSYSTPKAYWGDPGSSNQRDTTALNAFAIWATARGGTGTTRVYGLGAMEAYFPLPEGRVSEFYLAQVDAEHAGKTLEIRLWDPGDTGSLSADLQILAPGQSEYRVVDFDWTAERNSGSPGYSDCDGDSNPGGPVSSVTTNTGGNSQFNGCWLIITTPIVNPDDPNEPYTTDEAPTSDTVTRQGGWWKIRYNMGPGTRPATDLTTWQVQVLGNPVHLVPE